MSIEHALWLFPAVLTVHNLEEALWLPRWAARHRFPTPGQAVFNFAVCVITALGYGVTTLAILRGPQSFWANAAFGFMVAVLANVLVPHLAFSLLRRSYMPGLGSGLLLLLPVLSWLVLKALHTGFVSGEPALSAAIFVPLVLVAMLPALFFLGSFLVRVLARA